MPDTANRPNILLIMTDQQRYDAIGSVPGSQVDTPYLDGLRREGVHFTHMYSACPVCIPARRTLMSGQTPAHHGILANEHHEPLNVPTLPEALKNAGYQTHLCGKLHLFPGRRLYGFMSTDWADGASQSMPGQPANDYDRWLQENGRWMDASFGHGAHQNGFVARPFHMEERFHFTNGCVERAMRFLERRDPTMPFFLNVAFHQPHSPCTPPAYYFDKYMRRELARPYTADWDDELPCVNPGRAPVTYRVDPDAPYIRELRAGYFGSIEHIDHQIGRLLQHVPENTVIIFTSDHGDMLGDHGWIRKRNPYEGSAHVPLVVALPQALAAQLGVPQGFVCDTPAEIMDLMPTILSLAGVEIPATVDGLSLVPAMQGKPLHRDYIHGECCNVASLNSGMQYLTDGVTKYVWFPGLAKEQLFDLAADPHEQHDLSRDPVHADALAVWRSRLVRELDGRPEGFVQAGALVQLDGPTPRNINRM